MKRIIPAELIKKEKGEISRLKNLAIEIEGIVKKSHILYAKMKEEGVTPFLGEHNSLLELFLTTFKELSLILNSISTLTVEFTDNIKISMKMLLKGCPNYQKVWSLVEGVCPKCIKFTKDFINLYEGVPSEHTHI